MTVHDSSYTEFEESIRQRRKKLLLIAVSSIAAFVIVASLLTLLALDHQAKKGKPSYPAPVDTIKVVYIVSEPNPDSAKRGAQRTMQKVAPRFSAVVFVTPLPDSFPHQNPIDSNIRYLTAPNESTAIEIAAQFARDEQWMGTVKNRHLYFSFSPTAKLDSVMDRVINQGIFTGRARLALEKPE